MRILSDGLTEMRQRLLPSITQILPVIHVCSTRSGRGLSIGSVAVAPSDSEVVYLGMGEGQLRANVMQGVRVSVTADVCFYGLSSRKHGATGQKQSAICAGGKDQL